MRKIGTILSEAIKSFFKKPATSEYPKKRRDIHNSYAGMISFEQNKCIGCQICVRNCPANAIKIEKLGDLKVFSCELSLANCIFCSQCVFSCPKKALHTTDNFELAQIDKNKLTVKLEDLSPESKVDLVEFAKAQKIADEAKAKAAAEAAAKAQSTAQPQPEQSKSQQLEMKIDPQSK